MVQVFLARDSDSNEEILIENAERANSYVCMDCNSKLIPKNGGTKRAHHYAHGSKSNCTGETSSHKYCKHLLVKHIKDLTVVSRCRKCNRSRSFTFDERHTAKTECNFTNLYRVDVGVFVDETMVAALEVYHTHITTREKTRALCDGLSFFSEISTEELLSTKLTPTGEINGTDLCSICGTEQERRELLRIQRSMKRCVFCAKEYQCNRRKLNTWLVPKNYCSHECFNDHQEHKQQLERERKARLERERMNNSHKHSNIAIKAIKYCDERAERIKRERVEREREELQKREREEERMNMYRKIVMKRKRREEREHKERMKREHNERRVKDLNPPHRSHQGEEKKAHQKEEKDGLGGASEGGQAIDKRR